MVYMNGNIERLEQNDELKARIAKTKPLIRAELGVYAQLVRALKDADRKKTDAEKRCERRTNDKNAASLGAAVKIYDEAFAKASASATKLVQLISDVERDWGQLVWQIGILDSKAAPRENGDLEKYMRGVYAEKKKTDDLLQESGITLDVKEPTAPQPEGDAAASAALVDEAPEAATVNTAAEPVCDAAAEPEAVKTEEAPKTEVARSSEPLKIDISSHVERVVGIAMDKLAGALEKRIESYFATYVPQIPEGAVSAGGAALDAETVSLASKIADDEKALLEKLVGIVEVLKQLNTDMTAVSAAYSLIEAKNREIIEMQKENTDMQRHTLREQQGVQVNQRVVNTDQLKITEAQVAFMATQKKSADEQASLISAQNAMLESQRAVLETQASLEEAMKAVIAEQKRIIVEQQKIIAENTKQLEAGRAITQTQLEVLDSQRELGAQQRQIAKDQRATADKQKETLDVQKGITDTVRDVLKDARAVKVKKPE